MIHDFMSAGLETCRLDDVNCLMHTGYIPSKRWKWWRVCWFYTCWLTYDEARHVDKRKKWSLVIRQRWSVSCRTIVCRRMAWWPTCVHVRWFRNLPTCLFACMRLTSNIVIIIESSWSYHHHRIIIIILSSSSHRHHLIIIILSSSFYDEHPIIIIVSPSSYRDHIIVIILSSSSYRHHHHHLIVFHDIMFFDDEMMMMMMVIRW